MCLGDLEPLKSGGSRSGVQLYTSNVTSGLTFSKKEVNKDALDRALYKIWGGKALTHTKNILVKVPNYHIHYGLPP